MNMSLKGALILSAIIHAVVFAPFYNQHILKLEIEKKNSVVVDYVVLKEIVNAIQTNREVVLKRPETPRIDIKKEITVKPESADQRKADHKKRLEAKKLKEKNGPRKLSAAEETAKEAAKKEVQLKSNKDYVNYYQLIREKIRHRLKENYGYYNREGDVYLTFTITPNGSLLTYNVDRARSTNDEVLIHIASASLKAVSPFPPIPRSFSAPKMSFNIIISFKK